MCPVGHMKFILLRISWFCRCMAVWKLLEVQEYEKSGKLLLHWLFSVHLILEGQISQKFLDLHFCWCKILWRSRNLLHLKDSVFITVAYESSGHMIGGISTVSYGNAEGFWWFADHDYFFVIDREWITTREKVGSHEFCGGRTFAYKIS